jgi:hypothetical protein
VYNLAEFCFKKKSYEIAKTEDTLNVMMEMKFANIFTYYRMSQAHFQHLSLNLRPFEKITRD